MGGRRKRSREVRRGRQGPNTEIPLDVSLLEKLPQGGSWWKETPEKHPVRKSLSKYHTRSLSGSFRAALSFRKVAVA